MTAVSVMHVFYEVNMGCEHTALRQIMLDHKLDKLNKGEAVLFINRPFSACKLMVPGSTLAYFRGPGPGCITPEAVKMIPTRFGGTRLTFTKNLEMALYKQWDKLKDVMPAHHAKQLKVVGEARQ